ncbi:MAG: hypothetical protein CMJ78_23695 [Planctomycetaceae bacterium]|nr:hypothetical protein [Planctomycetaceae bacterium]
MISRRSVNVVEELPHFLFLPLGRYKEVSRFSECVVCGAHRVGASSWKILPIEEAANSTMEELAHETAPDVVARIKPSCESIETKWTSSERRQHQIDQFCRNIEGLFPLGFRNLSGWLGLVGIIFGVVSLIVLRRKDGGLMLWAIVTLCLALTQSRIRNWALHTYVGRRVFPKLGRFVEATNISLGEIEEALASGEVSRQFAQQHLARSRYNKFREADFVIEPDAGRNFIPVSWSDSNT